MKNVTKSEVCNRGANHKGCRRKLKSSVCFDDLDLLYTGYNGFGSGEGELYLDGHFYYVA